MDAITFEFDRSMKSPEVAEHLGWARNSCRIRRFMKVFGTRMGPHTIVIGEKALKAMIENGRLETWVKADMALHPDYKLH